MPGLDDAASRPRSAAEEALQERVADVLDRYVAALERGSAPSPEALIAQHPALAELLPQYLDGIDWIHGAMAAAARTSRVSLNPDDALPHEDNNLREKQQRIGDFQMLREIGRGGMGVVYEAVQLSLNRR
ncbi:MAG: hypothetical protein KDA37_01210, partial [Planctomycetales bacterium]|nr:hypothetical protein [Planctomycetales bacterium]